MAQGENHADTGFMNLFSENTNTIAQHGHRGANMQTLRIDHPDIEKLLVSKLVILIWLNIKYICPAYHKFMDAVKKPRL